MERKKKKTRKKKDRNRQTSTTQTLDIERCSHFHQFVCITATSTALCTVEKVSLKFFSLPFNFYLIFYLCLVMFDRSLAPPHCSLSLQLSKPYQHHYVFSLLHRTLQLPHNSFRCTFGTCVGVYMRERKKRVKKTKNKRNNNKRSPQPQQQQQLQRKKR